MSTLYIAPRFSLGEIPESRRTPFDKMLCEKKMRTLLFFVLILGAFVAAIAADPLVVHATNQKTGAVVDLIPNSVMSDSQLRLYCISGALAGAIISLALFKMTTVQEMASKLAVSGLSGVVFTPILMHWMNANLQLDYVLAYSAATALCSWTVLQIAVPLVGGWFAKWFSSKTNV